MDDAMIKKNANVFEEINWRRILRTDYWGLEMFEEGQWTHKSFRPLTILSFRWNYWLHSFDSTGFHVTNLVLHVLASLLLGALGFTSLGLPSGWSMLLAALFFAHPVHTESVLYIVGRADLLCCVGVFVAVLLYKPCITGSLGFISGSICLLLASAMLVAAGLCKETGFCFFGLLAGWEILGGLLAGKGRLASCGGWRWLRLSALLVLGSIVCYTRLWYTAGTAIERMDPHSNPVAVQENSHVRMLSYSLVHGIYAKLLVWPAFLCYDYSMDAVPLVHSTRDLRLLLPVTAYLAVAQLLTLSIWPLRSTCWERLSPARLPKAAREGPIVGMAVVVLSFIPMANVLFPVGTVIGEGLLYIPSAGLLIAAVSLAFIAGHKGGGSSKWAVLLLLLGAAATWRTAVRVPEWATSDAITTADGLRQLHSSRVQFNFANVHLQAKRHDEALFTYQRAIQIDPTYHDSLPLYHAGQILFYTGRHIEAETYLHKAVSGYYSPLTIKEEEIFHDYGLALWFVQKPRDSITNFEKSLTINPKFTKSLNNAACAAGLGALTGTLQRDFLQYGLQMLDRALQLEPANVLYWRNAVALLNFGGDQQAAMGAWKNVMALDPDGAAAGPPTECTWEFYFR